MFQSHPQTRKELRCRASGIVMAVNSVQRYADRFFIGYRRKAFSGIDGDCNADGEGIYSTLAFSMPEYMTE